MAWMAPKVISGNSELGEVLIIDEFAGHPAHTGVGGSLAEPGAQLIHGARRTAGNHLHAPVREIFGVVCEAQLLGLMAGGSAIEYFLNPTRYEAADTDIGRFLSLTHPAILALLSLLPATACPRSV